jgi:hypothetical protein
MRQGGLPYDERIAHFFRPCGDDLFHNGSRERADHPDAGCYSDGASNGIATCCRHGGTEELSEPQRLQKEKEEEEKAAKAAGVKWIAPSDGDAGHAARDVPAADDPASRSIAGSSGCTDGSGDASSDSYAVVLPSQSN